VSGGPRVLLMQLSERMSVKGNRYMAGWLGKASVVAFQADEPDKHGNPVWELFVGRRRPWVSPVLGAKQIEANPEL